MTIDERIKIEEKAIKDMQFKEEALDGLPGYMVTKEDYEECRKNANEHQELVNWLKELKAHREAWEKCIKEIKEWYWNADKQAIAKDPCVVDAMVDLFIRTIKECRPKEGDAE